MCAANVCVRMPDNPDLFDLHLLYTMMDSDAVGFEGEPNFVAFETTEADIVEYFILERPDWIAWINRI